VHEAPAHRWLSVAFTASETRSQSVWERGRQTRWPADTDIKRGKKTRGKGDSEGSGHCAVILVRGHKKRC